MTDFTPEQIEAIEAAFEKTFTAPDACLVEGLIAELTRPSGQPAEYDQLIERLEDIAHYDTYVGDNNEKEVCREAAEAIRELTLLQSGAKIISDEWEKRAVERQATIEELQEQLAIAVKGLRDIKNIPHIIHSHEHTAVLVAGKALSDIKEV